MASDKVDMSLDDIIKKSKVGRGRGRGRGRFFNGGGIQKKNGGATNNSFNNSNIKQRRNNNFRNNQSRRGRRFVGGVIRGGIAKRNTRSYIPRNIEGVWTHDLFEGTVANTAMEGKLLISNLDFGVNDSDMKELFSEFGNLKKAAVHYDFSGRSQGTAEIIFSSKQAAIQAMNRYNSVPLDGRPMKIQIVENASIKNRLKGNFNNNSNNNKPRGRAQGNRSFNGNNSFNRPVRRGQFRRGGRGGRGRGAGGRSQPTLTKEELDAQLDNYNKMEM